MLLLLQLLQLRRRLRSRILAQRPVVDGNAADEAALAVLPDLAIPTGLPPHPAHCVRAAASSDTAAAAASHWPTALAVQRRRRLRDEHRGGSRRR